MTTALHRRTVLRGAGAVLALPFLDAMLPGRGLVTRTASAAAARLAAADAAPVRMLFVFIPNGVEPGAWPGCALHALGGRAADVTVMRGLCHRNAEALGDGPGDHARSAACFLTGVHPKKTSGGDITAGVSVDQVAARRLSGRTRLDSIELGGEPTMRAGDCDSGYSCAYSANISWRGPHTPSGKEHDPRRAFELLFRDGPAGEDAAARARRLALRRSILDALRGQAHDLAGRLGTDDRRKLDEYLESVRAIERKVESMERAGTAGPGADDERRLAADPTGYAQRIELLGEIAALAFEQDRTRVATLMLANEGSNRAYQDAGVTDGHHEVSHHGNDAAKLAKFTAINRWQGERFARILDALAARRDAEGSVLDRTMVVYGAAITDGNRHNHDDLPVVLAGGRGLGIAHGPERVAPAGTPLCNLYVGMLRRAGVAVDRFGDSTGELPVGHES
jgi:hypothetical protein